MELMVVVVWAGVLVALAKADKVRCDHSVSGLNQDLKREKSIEYRDLKYSKMQ